MALLMCVQAWFVGNEGGNGFVRDTNTWYD